MNRLQKKCVIATAGIHLLLLTILIVGPAFFNPQPKTDNTQVLDVIPANLIDAAMNSGVRNATPPPPTPIVSQPQPQQQFTPPPKPVEPTPSLMAKLEKMFKSESAKPTPTNQSHTPKVDLHLVTRTAPQNVANPRDAKAIANAIKNLKSNLKSGTTINLSGESSVATANYASVVRSVYDAAWILPNTIAKDENITVSVTIANDGTVISSRIVTPSGDGPADDSVQRTLDRVTFVAPFPEGSTDKERTYTIIFNPQIKNSE